MYLSASSVECFSLLSRCSSGEPPKFLAMDCRLSASNNPIKKITGIEVRRARWPHCFVKESCPKSLGEVGLDHRSRVGSCSILLEVTFSVILSLVHSGNKIGPEHFQVIGAVNRGVKKVWSKHMSRRNCAPNQNFLVMQTH